MEKQILILIAISLMMHNASAACGASATAWSDITSGKCCISGTTPNWVYTAGLGVKTCPSTGASAAGDVDGTACLQGYYDNGAGALITCTACTAGNTAGDATNGSTATECTACPVNTYCPTPTTPTSFATNVNIAPQACPTGSTSAAGSDALADCVCTDATQILDTTASSGMGGCIAQTSYTGTGLCLAFASTTAGTCITCGKGHFLSGNICATCANNCDACTSNTVCTKASKGYFVSNNAPSSCAPNCDVCTSATACTTASIQFYVNGSGAPTACAPNCDACTATACTTASKGYYLGAASAVTQCPPNSTSCTFSTTVTVTGVVANYFVLSTAQAVATKCTDGLSSLATADGATATPVANAAAGCTIACSPNCRDCADAGAGQCDNCLDNFFLDSTTQLCAAITDTNRHPSCLTARGLTASDCLTCRDTDNRAFVKAKETDVTGMCSCQPTFTESGQTDATQFPTLSDRSACVQCGKGVATCQSASDTTPLAPITCTVTTNIIVSTMCAATTDKVDGYFYDSVAQQFAMCDTTCQTCAATGASACTACNDIPVATPASDDTVTLLKVWSNGTLPATGGVCYAQCPLTYEVQDDTRVNCVAQSFSYLISMIAVFISFILLI